MGGATGWTPLRGGRTGGLSPRGRGNRRVRYGELPIRGSIPAWAGQPPSPSNGRHWKKGLSPRGRGNLEQLGDGRGGWSVYPRVGGATADDGQGAPFGDGLSPRGRGNLSDSVAVWTATGSIPAWAGQPRKTRRDSRSHGVYPRVGGATPKLRAYPPPGRGLSPRGRGNRSPSSEYEYSVGSIPAWAGQPVAHLPGVGAPGVYPRVGGATFPGPPRACRGTGLSPRGRGNRM